MSETTGAQLPDGVSVGHYTDDTGRTGCTVILVPGGAVAASTSVAPRPGRSAPTRCAPGP